MSLPIVSLECNAGDITASQSRIFLVAGSPAASIPIGSSITIAGETVHTGFNGTWVVLGVVSNIAEVELTISCNYGSLLNVGASGAAITVNSSTTIVLPLDLVYGAANSTRPTYSIAQFAATQTNVNNKTSTLVLLTRTTQSPFGNGQSIVVSGVSSPYTGFNGTWVVSQQSSLQYNSGLYAWYVTIPYNLGSVLNVAASGTVTIATTSAEPFKIICGTIPNSGHANVSIQVRGTIAAVFGAVTQPVQAPLRWGVGKVFVQTTTNFASDTSYRRWASVSYNRQVFLTNELNPILFTDGAVCFRYSNQQPSARYIDVFFDHLVIGWPIWGGQSSPTRVQWSDLYRINQWIPSPKNEADSYDIEEWCRTDFPLYGCTGLGRIGNTMWVYTPTAIVSMRYQGRLKSPVFNQSLTGTTGGSGGPIMIVGDKVLKDVGNSLQWGLIIYKDMHYFWDGIEQDFYRFDGERTESIGIRIKQYFLNTINQSWPLFQATWGYARPGRQEIVWVFVSNEQTSLVFDQAIVYNWKTGKWYTQSVENTHCYNGPCLPAGRADDLVGQANSLQGTSDQLLVSTALTPPLWGSNGAILRESVDTDPDSALLGQDLPTLITKDYSYEDLEHIKEASSIVVHATDRYQNGVNVSLAVRDNLDDPVQFVEASLYKYAPEEKRLGLPRSAGRLLRYRFQPATTKGPVRGFSWGGFVENVKRKVTDA